MASDELDVIFQLGGEIKPEFYANLRALADAMDSTGERMTASVASLGSNIVAETRAIADAGREASSQSATPPQNNFNQALVEAGAARFEKWKSENSGGDGSGSEEFLAEQKKLSDAIKKQAEDEAKFKIEQIKVVAAEEEARRAENAAKREERIQKRIDNEKKREEEAAQKDAERAELEQQREDELAAKRRQNDEERAKRMEEFKAELQESGESAQLELLEEQQAKLAAEAKEASDQSAEAMANITELGTKGAEAFMKMGRALALFNFSQEEGNELSKETLQQLALMQAGIDAVQGAYEGMQAVIGIIDNIHGWLMLKTVATDADAAATKAGEAASNLRSAALAKEAGATNALAGATERLTATRVADTAASRSGTVSNALSGGGGGIFRRGGRAVGRGLARAGSAVGITSLGASAGAIAGTGVAALGALAFAAKSASEMFKEVTENGYRQGAAYGSWTDVIATQEVKFVDAILDVSRKYVYDFGDLVDQEKTERMRAQMEEIKAKEEHQAKLFAFEMEMAKGIADIQKRRNQEMLGLALEGAEGPSEKLELIRDAAASAAEALATAKAELDNNFDNQGELRGSVDNIDVANAAREEFISASELYESLTAQRIAAERAVGEEKRDQREKEISGIQDIIKARQEEADALKKQIQSAAEQYADLGKAEQRAYAIALEKGRRGVNTLTEYDVESLSKVDSEESSRLIAEWKRAKAEREGFNDLGLSEFDKLAQAERDQEEKRKQLAEIANKPGVQEAIGDQKLELVDARQIAVLLENEDKKIVEDLLAETTKVLDARFTQLKLQYLAALEEREKERAEKERAKGTSSSPPV